MCINHIVAQLNARILVSMILEIVANPALFCPEAMRLSQIPAPFPALFWQYLVTSTEL